MLTKMENKFQFFNKTGQRDIPMKSFGTLEQQIEKRYCPGKNGTSGHFTLNSWHITTSSCPHLTEERPEDDLLGSKHVVKNFRQDEIHLSLI